MKKSVQHLFGDLLLFLVAIIWGLGFIAVKIGLEDGVAPFYLMFLRFGVATLALIPIVLYSVKKKNLTFKKKTMFNGILLGLFMFVGFAFQTIGLNNTTTSNNAFLTGVNVVLVPFLAFFIIKKPLKLKSVLAAVLTLVGIGVLSLDNKLTMNLGDLLTLVCAVMFAFHITITALVAKDDSPIVLVFMQMIVSTLLSGIVTLLIKEPHSLSMTSSLAILYLGVLSTMVAFLLQTIGQRYAHAAQAAMILSTESLFGPFFAIIILGDLLTTRLLIGGLIIFVAIFLSEADINIAKLINKDKTRIG